MAVALKSRAPVVAATRLVQNAASGCRSAPNSGPVQPPGPWHGFCT